jgi:ABC-type branched-subunit amino acid transport system substrate-binding protein
MVGTPRRLLSSSVAVALLLAACGTSTTTTTGKQPTGPVSMGVLSCFTGSLASLGNAMLQGSQMAQKAINDAGGILGQQLKLSHADTQCDEADSVPAVRKLLSDSQVVGIIGPETQEINAVAPIVSAAKIPTQFQGGSTAFDHNANPYLWRDSPSDSQLGVAMALYAYQKGYRKAGLLFYSDIAAQTFADPITATWAKLGGTIAVRITDLAPGQTSYRTQVQKVIDAKPDVIFTQTDAPTAAVLFKNFKELDNLAIPFVGTDVTGGDDYLKAITFPVAHDHLISVYGTSVSGAATDEFNRIFALLFPGPDQPQANANYAYDAVISQALAVVKANSITGSDINNAMTQVTNTPGTACYTYKACLDLVKAGTKINYEGASGPLNYNTYHNVFGPYGAWQQTLAGQQSVVQTMTADQLAAATP